MPIAPLTPPLAELDLVQAGWIDGLAPFVVLLVYIIRQVMSALQEQREAEKAKRAAAEREPLAPEMREAKAAGDQPEQGELRSEVEEFLRRVGQQREAQPTDEPLPPRPTRQLDPFEEPPRRRVKAAPKPKPVEPVLETEAPPAEPRRKPRQELRHLPESQLAEEAAHLGEHLSQTDERLAARLQQKFDHRLGKLGGDAKVDAPAAEPITNASRIKRLLAEPSGVRDAFVLSEILGKRPE